MAKMYVKKRGGYVQGYGVEIKGKKYGFFPVQHYYDIISATNVMFDLRKFTKVKLAVVQDADTYAVIALSKAGMLNARKIGKQKGMF
jgi:hypothetical protein